MKKILIVDDARFMRMMIKSVIDKHLSDKFVVVGEADNGLDAVKKYEELSPDIVTMDITMPECDGIQAVKMIRNINPNANIIMVSAMGQKLMIIDAIEAGAKDFIIKPFDETKVVESLLKLK